jgi:hypothetical protein
MGDTNYAPGPIKCRECGYSLETIEQVHLQSGNCTGQISDVGEYRNKYPDAPTRSTEMLEKIRSGIKEQ